MTSKLLKKVRLVKKINSPAREVRQISVDALPAEAIYSSKDCIQLSRSVFKHYAIQQVQKQPNDGSHKILQRADGIKRLFSRQ